MHYDAHRPVYSYQQRLLERLDWQLLESNKGQPSDTSVLAGFTSDQLRQVTRFIESFDPSDMRKINNK